MTPRARTPDEKPLAREELAILNRYFTAEHLYTELFHVGAAVISGLVMNNPVNWLTRGAGTACSSSRAGISAAVAVTAKQTVSASRGWIPVRARAPGSGGKPLKPRVRDSRRQRRPSRRRAAGVKSSKLRLILKS